MLHWETSTLFTASWYLSDGLNLDKIGNLDETGDFGRTKKDILDNIFVQSLGHEG